MVTKSFAITCGEITRRPGFLVSLLAGASVFIAATTLATHLFGTSFQQDQPPANPAWQLRDSIFPSAASNREVSDITLKGKIIANNTPYQEKLIKDFYSVQKAVNDCEKNIGTCDERMAAYSEGVDVATLYAAQKNFNPLAVTGTMELTVNMLMRYDDEEAKNLDKGGRYRPADKAIKDGLGVCLEQSIAKFIGVILALQKAHVHIDEISITIEKVRDSISIDQLRKTGLPATDLHAIMTIKTGGKVITYNNQAYTLNQSIRMGGKINEASIPKLIQDDSTAETLGPQENFWGDSTIEADHTQFYPIAKFDLTNVYPIISETLEPGLDGPFSYHLTSDGHDLLARLFKDLAAANDITIVAAPPPKADRLPRPQP